MFEIYNDFILLIYENLGYCFIYKYVVDFLLFGGFINIIRYFYNVIKGGLRCK